MLTSLPRIFIIEGLATCALGVFGKFFIVDWPEKAAFLTDDEKLLLVARLSADVGDAKMNTLDAPARKRVFGDWKIYIGTLMYFGVVNTGLSSNLSTSLHPSVYTY